VGQVAFRRGFLSVAQTCPSCGGAGRVNRDPCSACGGRGRSERETTLKVSVPAGVDSGMRLRLASEGEAGVLGGPRGDLFVVMAVADHELFERDGENLHLELPVSVYQAMLGTTVPISTVLGEEQEIEVPAGTQPGDAIRIVGSGMPNVNGRRRGDLYVHLRVVIPKKLSGEQRRLIQELAELGGGFEPETDRGFFDRLRRAFGSD
jgi:molecular chaperone DnaJ